VYIVTRRKSASSLPLPPGPKPLPIIGNVHQAPKSYGWRTYREWSKQYGPIVHINMLGQPVIILSTSEVARDLLAKRGAIFSDRPRLFVRLYAPVANSPCTCKDELIRAGNYSWRRSWP
jgi:hypothetical protein